MIKASELQLFNKVLYGESVSNIVVVEFNTDDGRCYIKITDSHGGIAYVTEEDINPISLTPEWLERCGFVEDRGGWNLPGTQFSLTEKYYPCWMDRMLWPQDIPDFKHLLLQYVHQLQNLFYYLTLGQELAITQPFL